MKKRYTMFRLLRSILHACLIVGVFLWIYKLRLMTDLIPGVQLRIPPINYQETLIYAIISGLVFTAIGILKGLYELHKPIQKYFQTFTKVWMYRVITITFLAYFGQGFVFFFGISRFIIIISAVLVFIFLFIIDQVWNFVEQKTQKNGNEKIIIIGGDALETAKVIDHIKENFPFKTEFVRTKEIEDVDLEKYFMVVVVGSFPKALLQDIFEKTRYSATRFYHISEGFFLEDVVYEPETINNIIALEYKNSTLDGWSLVWKRIFDIVGSLGLIVVLSPIMILIGILIKIDSKGPIVYIQKRVGKRGRTFRFLKFRSMYTHLSTGDNYGGVDADKLYQKLIDSDANIRNGVLPKIKDDPRITRIGKWLRKSSLDELPQLLCVLCGTMSLVGPRPHLPSEVAHYESWQKRLLSIKPGITGYAQVFGRDALDFQEEAKLDLYYIQNWSLLLDVYILFSTVKVAFKGK